MQNTKGKEGKSLLPVSIHHTRPCMLNGATGQARLPGVGDLERIPRLLDIEKDVSEVTRL